MVDYAEYEDPLNRTTPSEPHGARVASSLWPFTVPTVGSADLHTFYMKSLAVKNFGPSIISEIEVKITCNMGTTVGRLSSEEGRDVSMMDIEGVYEALVAVTVRWSDCIVILL